MTESGTTAGVSRDEFLKRIASSGLSNAKEIRRFVEEAPDADSPTVRDRLIERGMLTRYQIEAVLAERLEDLSIGNYEVLDRLGSGGMGTVFKARHRRMKRIVALKTLSAEVARSPRFTERFQREVETVARLSHPNIVMAFDADDSGGVPFLVMEFVDGRDLQSEVLRDGPMSTAAAVDALLQSARGLEYAHAQGIVHRDVKPGNLLKDVHGLVKVADLGLARLTSGGDSADRSLTIAGAVIGTLDFMAPEQALDAASTDGRADVYSLGCTLYYLLTGDPVYTAVSAMGLLLAHRESPIPSLQAAGPEVPKEVEDLFRAMVAKAPKDRPAKMTDVVQGLEALANSGKLSNVRPSLRGATAASPSDVFANTMAHEGPIVGGSDSFALGSPTSSTATNEFVVPRRLLIVEPSRVQAGIVKKLVAALGMPEPTVAASGQAALEAVKSTRPDVVVSTLHLNDMTGHQLADALFAEADGNGLGFILATSATEADSAELGASLDPRIVLLHKPFDQRRLSEAINAAVGRRAGRQA